MFFVEIIIFNKINNVIYQGEHKRLAVEGTHTVGEGPFGLEENFVENFEDYWKIVGLVGTGVGEKVEKLEKDLKIFVPYSKMQEKEWEKEQ